MFRLAYASPKMFLLDILYKKVVFCCYEINLHLEDEHRGLRLDNNEEFEDHLQEASLNINMYNLFLKKKCLQQTDVFTGSK